MTTPHVLVLDDRLLNQKLFARYLGSQGLRVSVASSVAEAESVLVNDRPALVLLEVYLRHDDGLAFVQRARAQGGPPMVAVTARAHPAARDEALAAGCVGYLSQPVELRALLALTQACLPYAVRSGGDAW